MEYCEVNTQICEFHKCMYASFAKKLYKMLHYAESIKRVANLIHELLTVKFSSKIKN